MVLRGEQKFRAALPPQKEPRYPLEEAIGLHDWSGQLLEKRKSIFPTENRAPDSPPRSKLKQ